MRPGTAIALLALFVALGGTGYASLTLPKNSVTTIQVKDRSLLARDFKRGQVPRGKAGAPGSPGIAGAPGPKGDKGDPGVPGAAASSLWAVVASSGSLVRGSHALSAQPGANYGYIVEFDRDVSACAYTATADANAYVSASLFFSGGPVPTKVFVDSFNGPSGARAPSGFSLVVTC